MRNRHYMLLISDSSGRSVRRVAVSRRSIEWVVGILVLFCLLVLAASVHSLTRYGAAKEAVQVREENRQLRRVLADLDNRIPGLRRVALRAELTFAQLWSKSGLGIEPRLLGVGPLDEEGPKIPGSQTRLAAPFNGEVLAALPVALPLEAERVRNQSADVQHALAGLVEYFHDAERLLSQTPSLRPTPASAWKTSGFGRRRDPIYGYYVMHKGVDLAGHTGMEVMAPADGVAIFTGRRGGYGMTVVLDHGFGLQTHFAHLSRYRVRVGQRVRRGEVIAEMGSTGKSTGPHLHYEVRRKGQPLNPTKFILD